MDGKDSEIQKIADKIKHSEFFVAVIRHFVIPASLLSPDYTLQSLGFE